MIENADRNRFTGMLRGKKVILAVTASISIYRVPDLVRELRREGADVIVGMSIEAADLVSPKIFEWASGHPVVTGLTGKIEHITLFNGLEKDTCLLIAPCTHNTMGKIANGISDDVPSAFFSFAVGKGNPMTIAPAMHEGMYRNPANMRNVQFLESVGVKIVPPELSEEKAKLSGNSEIVDYVCRSFFQDSLRDRKVMIIGGHTEEPIDPVRSVSNHGTGFTGYWLARSAFRFGASMITYVGNYTGDLPGYTQFHKALKSDEVEREALKELEKGYDIVMSPAAISDFTVHEPSDAKLDSSSEHSISLEPRGKIIDAIRKKFKGTLVAFNLTADGKPDAIKKKFSISKPQMIVSNSFSRSAPFGETINDYAIFTDRKKELLENVSKPEMAVHVMKKISGFLVKNDE